MGKFLVSMFHISARSAVEKNLNFPEQTLKYPQRGSKPWFPFQKGKLVEQNFDFSPQKERLVPQDSSWYSISQLTPAHICYPLPSVQERNSSWYPISASGSKDVAGSKRMVGPESFVVSVFKPCLVMRWSPGKRKSNQPDKAIRIQSILCLWCTTSSV